MATYVILLAWVLGSPVLFMIGLTSVGRFIPGWLTRWSRDINPYRMLIGPISAAGPSWHEPWIFLAATIAIAIVLVTLAAWRLRPSALAVAGGAPSLVAFSATHEPAVRESGFLSGLLAECRLQAPLRWVGLFWRCYMRVPFFSLP